MVLDDLELDNMRNGICFEDPNADRKIDSFIHKKDIYSNPKFRKDSAK